jgi:hypothetical protein
MSYIRIFDTDNAVLYHLGGIMQLAGLSLKSGQGNIPPPLDAQVRYFQNFQTLLQGSEVI